MFKSLDIWLPRYLCHRRKRLPTEGPTDVMLAICDHFEPLHGADKPEALRRVRRWRDEYPDLIAPFLDADGRRPRHTFFYPIEQQDRDLLSGLAEISALSGAEVEMHLHHENDTPASLRNKLLQGREDLAQYGFLARDQAGGVRYGFIHGNWALDNSHPHGLYCGVSTELGVLQETGCYADFTLPAAPNPAQTRTINSIYYAQDTPEPKSHDTGVPASVGPSGSRNTPRPDQGLLLIQGPLGLNWEWRKCGLFPRIECGDLTGANPPIPARVRLWMRLGIHVVGQPNWVFIKLHTHGGIPRNMATLLEDPMRRFFDYLLATYNDGRNYRLHFVTAREMTNIVHAAENGEKGNPGQFRNYCYRPAKERGTRP